MAKIFLSGLLVLGLATLSAWLVTASPGAKMADSPGLSADPELAVKTWQVTPRSYLEYGEYFGRIEGFEQARLSAYGGGRVAEVFVKNGDQVKKGQKLCDIDGQKFSVNYRSALLLEGIEQKNFERIKRHRQAGSASLLQEEQAELKWLQAKSALLDAAKAKEGAYCLAPFAGTVASIFISKHQDVGPGEETMVIARLDEVKLMVGIPESEISAYGVGRKASVSLNSQPGQSWSGEIDNIAQQINERDKTFNVEIHVGNPNKLLKPGQTAKVKIIKHNFNDKIVIPTRTILTRERQQVVMVVDEQGLAHKRAVEVFSTSQDQALVSAGLEVGERLIVKGQHQVAEGTKVKIVP